jgi:diguanylate cyclase (GGDEF)-like protein
MLAQQPIALLDNGGTINVTVSSGLCQLRDEQDTLEQMLIRADKALYLSKQNGRNQCTLFH